MQVNETGQTRIAESRRAEIAEAATDVIAEYGLAKATFARVTKRAGMSSTRMVSYYFTDKDDLTMTALTTALGKVDEAVDARLAPVRDRVEMFRAYIEAQVGLLQTHARYLRAITEIGYNARDDNGVPMFEPVLRDYQVGRLERQLRQGQREGVFGAFDVTVMAQTIRLGIDGAAHRRSTDPEVDLAAYGRELSALFHRATMPR